MRVVITGATGNVGTAVLRRLTPQRDVDVVGVVRRPPDTTLGAVRWVAADLSVDACEPDLRSAFEGADAVVHLAWAFQPSHHPDYLAEVGVGGTRRVLRAATDAGVGHLVHVSSVGAYSPRRDDHPVDESWPTEGIPSSPYSRHKVGAERLLDEHVATGDGPTVARLRPGVVGQRRAGSALLRYGIPGYVPAGVLRLLPLLPLDRRLRIPVVHADDVAQAIDQVLTTSAVGAFNLATASPASPTDIAEAMRARHVHVPAAVLRAGVSASWHARVQQLDPGWLDLAMQVPVMDSGRARRELGWSPTWSTAEVLRETVEGLVDAAHTDTPVLRPRTLTGRLRDTVRRGPVSSRSRP